MNPFEFIPVWPVVATGSVICAGIALVVLNARSRAIDPDIRAGLGLLLVSVGALFLGSLAMLLDSVLTFAAGAFLIVAGAVVCHVFGYAALLRGVGGRPAPWLIGALILGPIGAVALLLLLQWPIWLIIAISSLFNASVIAGIVWHLHAATIQMGRAQMLLVTQPFGLVLIVYLARMVTALTTADEGLLIVLTMALGFVLCFATLTWCFGLMAFGLVRLARSLRAERQRAEAASRTKSEFLANMSHEVRTPLNGILGMAQLLEDRIRGPTEREMLAVVRQSGEDLLHVLNDILDLSKVEAGRLDLDPVPFRPAELIERIERLYRLRAEDKKLTLEVRQSPALERLVLGDANRILQVLHNLMGNALKFTERGRVDLLADWRDSGPAEGGGPARGWLELTIADTGIGMSPEQQDKVFEDFVQADGSITRRYGGTGLGLSLSRRLVGLMGGTIRVESQLGIGTRFTVRLPMAQVAAAEIPQPPASDPSAAPAAPSPTLDGLRLLLAEDNATNRRVVEAMLAGTGALLRMVPDGRAAVEAVLAAEPQFDLLLMDVSMPELDGPGALRRIRQALAEAGRPVPPALVLTANAMTHQIADYLADGFVAHLAKPVRRADLVAMIQHHGQRNRAAQDRAA